MEESFQDQLIKDYASAEKTVKSSQEGAGFVAKPADFTAQALRIKNKASSKQELDTLNRAISQASNDLLFNASMLSQAEKFKAQQEINKKMNWFKMQGLRKAISLEKEIAKKKLDAKQKYQLAEGVAKVSETSAYWAMMSYGKQTPAQTTGTPSITGEPSTTSIPVGSPADPTGEL